MEQVGDVKAAYEMGHNKATLIDRSNANLSAAIDDSLQSDTEPNTLQNMVAGIGRVLNSWTGAEKEVL